MWGLTRIMSCFLAGLPVASDCGMDHREEFEECQRWPSEAILGFERQRQKPQDPIQQCPFGPEGNTAGIEMRTGTWIRGVDVEEVGNNMVLLCLPLLSNSTKYVPRG